MRPIDKGTVPVDDAGNEIHFAKYQEARPYLIQRLGELCSYCEMHLDSGLAVEHVQPKSLSPENERDWDNLLLACPNCNSSKGNAAINDSNMDDYLWPDRHNTFLALIYREGGIVKANPELNADIQQRAARLINLVGLDRTPDKVRDATDRRWMNRIEAWDLASRSRERLMRQDSNTMREQIVDQANDYFSIWMTFFEDDVDMRQRFIRKFRGTCTACFDENGTTRVRIPGQV